ncbi:lipopolysaccharide biosynthesis protein [Xylanibacter brevis]|uniref:lipopolysaccharide biosynthesis protein n=1 Tax=Xylanibacter brevis TaxID=83231 RepID=UPI000AF23698|nr:lipopolysaccharide biosynthesis protein [Xylanibacter brevis]
MMAETLKEKTAKGLFWGGLSNGVQQVLALVFGIILARKLDRGDYGMIAMIAIFSVIATELQSSGFKTALLKTKNPQHEDYNSVFWFNVFAGLILYAILFFSAPFIADFYHKPELVLLCRYAFLGFVFSSWGMAQSAYLTKNLKIKEVAKCTMIATLASCVIGVVMAYCHCSYWSLATQSLTLILINTLLLWYYSPWRPTLHIDFGPVKRMFPFSVNIMLSAILMQVNANIMSILLGRYFTKEETGDYSQAYKWSSMSMLLLQGMLKQVDVPVLAGLQDERERQLRVLRKMMRFTAFISFPVLFGFALVSHEFIMITIGQKWEQSAQLLPYLCLSCAFVPLVTLMQDAIVARGKSNIYMVNTCLLGLAQLALLYTLWPYGLRVMVCVFVAVNLLWVPIWFFFLKRLTGYRWTSFFADFAPFALSAFGVMGLTYLLTCGLENDYLLLSSRILIAALLYYAVMRIAKVKILDECQQFVLQKIRKNDANH